jgi:hypothetical protein
VNADADRDEGGAFVLAHLQGAARAVRNQDMEKIVRWLGQAVRLYEAHPSFVVTPGGDVTEGGVRVARCVEKLTLRSPDHDEFDRRFFSSAVSSRVSSWDVRFRQFRDEHPICGHAAGLKHEAAHRFTASTCEIAKKLTFRSVRNS